MPLPSPAEIGWAPQQLLNGMGGYSSAIDPDLAYNPQGYGESSMTPEQMAEWQAQFWVPKIATGGYIPPQFDNAEYMASIGQSDAYAQRQQYLNAVGAQRIAALQDHQADSRDGGLAARGALAVGAIGGMAGALGGGAVPASSSATTYPLATGGPVSATPLASAPGTFGQAATISGSTAAAGIPAAAGAANSLSNVPKWLDYAIPGINALVGGYAANQAVDAETAGLQAGIDEQRRQFDTTRNDLMPWLQGGTEAINRLRDPQTNFLASPGYEWAREQGLRDVGNSWASRGGAASGNALRALAEFQTGLAQQDYGNWFGQQLNLAGLGSDTARSVGALGANAAANTGNFMAGQGQSRASGVLGRYGSLANAGSDIYQNYLYRRRP